MLEVDVSRPGTRRGARDRLFKALRFARLILREFRIPLGVFFGLVLGGGLLINLDHPREASFLEACHEMFALVFNEHTKEFPKSIHLEILYFLTPLVGLVLIADGLVRVGVIVLSKKAHLREWWLMEASTYRNHIVVAGVGKVGYRIIRQLQRMGEPVVGLDRDATSHLVMELQGEGVCILSGDVRLKSSLLDANVQHARAIICSTDDDLANLDAGLTSRSIHPKIRVVLRIFDDTIAAKFEKEFDIPAISTSQTAAPVFAAAATQRSVLYTVRLKNLELDVIDFTVRGGTRLAGMRLGDLEDKGVRLIAHQSGRDVSMRPDADARLKEGDTIVVAASADRVAALQALTRG
ncbi:MAG TPA: NAD-binding protein [Planctomycetota bacterium]|nr:NAD-binding protein [Planctomycetota bacterium]